jgi:hypothetical protein
MEGQDSEHILRIYGAVMRQLLQWGETALPQRRRFLSFRHMVLDLFNEARRQIIPEDQVKRAGQVNGDKGKKAG